MSRFGDELIESLTDNLPHPPAHPEGSGAGPPSPRRAGRRLSPGHRQAPQRNQRRPRSGPDLVCMRL